MNNTENWISVKEAAELLGVSKQAIIKSIEKYNYKESPSIGGKKYFYLDITSLIDRMTPEQRVKYYSTVNVATEQKNNDEADWELFSNAPEHAKRKAIKYIALIRASEGLSGQKLMRFITEWNKNNPDKQSSYKRLLPAREIYQKEGVAGLLGRWGKTAGTTIVNEADFEYFKSLYLKEGSPTLNSCWLETLGNHIRTNAGAIPENFPSASTFKRLIEKRIPEQTQVYIRKGERYWNKTYAMYANRRSDDLECGQLWVSDHRQLDQAVMNNAPTNAMKQINLYMEYLEEKAKGNKPVFPWITVWRDFKSGLWLGWYLHTEAPNADHIFMSFYLAVEKYGLPKEIYIDNGKDYRSKDFAGGKRKIKVQVDEAATTSMMELLNIEVHFSKPYNGQSKPIERDFRNVKDWMDKQMPGYRGGNIVERPEKLINEIKQGKIIGFTEYSELVDYFISNVINKYESNGKILLGQSPESYWNKSFVNLRRVTPDALKLFCMRSSEHTVGRLGITVCKTHNIYYSAEWLFPLKGKKVYMRRDIKKYQEAWIFDSQTNEYLGKAVLNVWDTSAIAKTDLQKEQLKSVLSSRQKEIKINKTYIPTIEQNPREMLENLAAGLAATSKSTTEVSYSESNMIMKTFMDEVLVKDEEMKSTGTYGTDYSKLTDNKKAGRKIYSFRTDKEFDE